MRVVQLGAALLAAIAVLAGTPAARAQDAGYGGSALPTGAGARSSRVCGSEGPAPDPSAYAYGRQACRPAADRGASSRDRLCASPYRGYSGLLYSDPAPFFAPGGEAYSYAGYGSSYSPYLLDTEAPAVARGDSADGSAASLGPPACTSPTGLPATSGTQPTRLLRQGPA